MSYEVTKLTNGGKRALSAALAGEQLTYTKIIMGDGYIPSGQSTESMTAMSSEIETVNITKLAEGKRAGTTIVGGVFSNQNRQNGFYFRELGVFATTPTTGEILYSYANAGDLAEWIPEGTSSKIVDKNIDCVTIIDTATQVYAVLSSGVYASVQQVSDASNLAQTALDKANAADNKAQEALDQRKTKCQWIIDLEARVKKLEDAVFNDITRNSFTVSFNTLDGKTVQSGNFNKAAGRLET